MNLDFADVKPSVLSWLIVGLMAVTFIAFVKFMMMKYPVPGLAQVVQAV